MKRLHGLLKLGAMLSLFAVAACENEFVEPQPSQNNNTGNVYMDADDFCWDGVETRSALNIDGGIAKFSWTPGDLVGILPDKGAQVYFEIPEHADGVEQTDAERRRASFDGGAWALKAESNYAAYYPFVKDFDLDRTKVPVNYKDQKQTGATTAHLGAYDFMGARPSVTNVNGGVAFDFDHVGALVLLRFTVPVAGTMLKSVTLKAERELFVTEGTYDLTSDKSAGFPITASEKSSTMTVGLDYTTKANDEEVTAYFMCAPVDLSAEKLEVTVAYGNAGKTFDFEVNGKNLKGGGAYLLKENIPYLTFTADAEQTMKVVTEGGYVLDESLQYSVGGGAWKRLTADTEIAFGGEGNDLRLRGKSSTGTAENKDKYSRIIFGKKSVSVACTGDIRTLQDYTNYNNVSTAEARFCHLFYFCGPLTSAPVLPATTLADYCYQALFVGCNELITAPVLPATTMAESCYDAMFYGCYNLNSAPALPAEALAPHCYSSMFSGCTSLTTPPVLPATILADHCYFRMFWGCSNLISAPVLPAKTLVASCYSDMFGGCTSLTTAPVLPAETLASACYSGMFSRCTSLTVPPALPAEKLATLCYSSMFSGCTSLTTAPALPAETMAYLCYSSMFSGCTSLTTPPALPAKSLDRFCYLGMFSGCNSLTTAPTLSATSLMQGCYQEMFSGCTSLNSATMMATDISANGCLTDWMKGVSATGTFTKAAEMTSLPEGNSGIPSGWTVVNKE